MRVHLLHYPVTALGPGDRLGLWVQGCQKRCFRCIADTMQAFDERYQVSLSVLVEDIARLVTHHGVHRITITGGEPFDNEDFSDFLVALRALGFDDILCYTGYRLDNLSDDQSSQRAAALSHIDVLVDDVYVDKLNTGHPLRGSDNQTIYVLNRALEKLYKEYMQYPRQYQTHVHDNKYLVIGLLNKGESMR